MRHVEHCMGTVFSFDVRTPGVDIAPAVTWLHHVEAVFSTFHPDSDISRLASGRARLRDCDPLVAEVLEIGAAAEREGAGAFTLHPRGRLDPAAVVKGWAIERASRILVQAGSVSHLINGGGDIQTVGGQPNGLPWRVALSDPALPSGVSDVVAGFGIAVATSGTAERGDHIVDHRSGLPTSHLRSVTVIGSSLGEVDIAATTAFALGGQSYEWLRARRQWSARVVDRGGRVWTTANFHAQARSLRVRAAQPTLL